jgi:hypothetical protein
MQISPADIDTLLQQTPNTPDNAALIQALSDMRNAASIVKYPFSYTAVFNTAAGNNLPQAGAAVTVNVQIDAGSPFLIVSQSYWSNSDNTASTRSGNVVPNIVVLLTDTGSNRQLMDVPQPVDAIFGSGQFPFMLPEPKLMQARAVNCRSGCAAWVAGGVMDPRKLLYLAYRSREHPPEVLIHL